MKFGDKLRVQRKKRGLSQTEAAAAIGVTMRTFANYERGASHPQDRTIYSKLASFFEVDINYFLTEDEEFLTSAAELFGKKGQAQAKALLEQTAALFAGGELSDSDKEAFSRDMQNIFITSTTIAREKFTPKKYRRISTSNKTEK